MLMNKTRIALAVATISLAACGGGGGSSSEGSSPGTTPTVAPAAVPGPLDTAQNAVSTQVFAPLVEATAGTPLQSVLACGNSIVTRNTLDIGDALANALASPSTLASTAPAAAQGAVTALVGNLSGLLGSLTGQITCLGGSSGDIAVPTTNPLAGTPLEPLGNALLPVLTSAAQQLTAAGNGTAPQLSATQLATIVGQLNDAFASALGQLPPEALTAPVVGGSLVTIGNSLANLDMLTTLASTGGSPTALAAAFQTLAQSSLSDLLTLVLPAGALQDAAGTGAPDVVGMIQTAVATLTGSLGTDPTTALPANPLTNTDFTALTDLVNQLSTLLPTGLTGSTGTPLDTATGPLLTLINSLFAPATGGTGTGSGCLLGILCLG